MVNLPMHEVVVTSRTPTTRCPASVVICCLWLIGMAGTKWASGSDRPEVARIRQIWNAQRNEILTARIDYRIARRGLSADTTITPAEFRAVLVPADINFDDAGVDSVVRSLDAHVASEDPTSVMQRLTVNGDWQRVFSSIDGVERTQVHTDLADIRLGANSNQINVYAAGTCPVSMTSLDDLRLIPSLLEDDESVVVSMSDADRMEIESPRDGLRIVADLHSGFVYEYSKGTEARSMRLTFQYNPTQYADGIIFPACRIDGTFSRGVLTLVTITMVTNAQFNIRIADDAFDVAARTGTRVLDFREDRRSPKLLILDGATANVLASLDQAVPDDVLQIQGLPEDDKFQLSSDGRHRQRMVVAAAVILLVAGTVLLWYRLRVNW